MLELAGIVVGGYLLLIYIAAALPEPRAPVPTPAPGICWRRIGWGAAIGGVVILLLCLLGAAR